MEKGLGKDTTVNKKMSCPSKPLQRNNSIIKHILEVKCFGSDFIVAKMWMNWVCQRDLSARVAQTEEEILFSSA